MAGPGHHHVRRELDGFVHCGEPTSGFAWLQCTSCDHHRLVPFSCKGRGFCPCCGGRRMAAFAARMVDEVLPAVPVRQWVLSLPWDIRALLAWRPPLARGVLRVAFRVIQRFYRDRVAATAGVQGASTGSVTVLQRFGSDLRLNPHFHSWSVLGMPWTVSSSEYWELTLHEPVVWLGYLIAAAGGVWVYLRDHR